MQKTNEFFYHTVFNFICTNQIVCGVREAVPTKHVCNINLFKYSIFLTFYEQYFQKSAEKSTLRKQALLIIHINLFICH